ncbi:Voltage-dependent calcium channel subunit alpha-2/delta-3, partial [Galemys pyrenaicus]
MRWAGNLEAHTGSSSSLELSSGEGMGRRFPAGGETCGCVAQSLILIYYLIEDLWYEYFNAVLINERDKDGNFLELGKEFILAPNDHFNNLPVNISLSDVQVPTNMYNKGTIMTLNKVRQHLDSKSPWKDAGCWLGRSNRELGGWQQTHFRGTGTCSDIPVGEKQQEMPLQRRALVLAPGCGCALPICCPARVHLGSGTQETVPADISGPGMETCCGAGAASVLEETNPCSFYSKGEKELPPGISEDEMKSSHREEIMPTPTSPGPPPPLCPMVIVTAALTSDEEGKGKTHQSVHALWTIRDPKLQMKGYAFQIRNPPQKLLGGFERSRRVEKPKYPAIVNGVYWSESLNKVFVDNFDRDPSLIWQYFGSAKGFFRQYPEKLRTHFCFIFPQPRYIQAATSPKDVIILVDVSGSMKGLRLTIAKQTVSSILDTLGDDDFFNIIAQQPGAIRNALYTQHECPGPPVMPPTCTGLYISKYNEELHYVEPCLNGTLVQADRTNKEELQQCSCLADGNMTRLETCAPLENVDNAVCSEAPGAAAYKEPLIWHYQQVWKEVKNREAGSLNGIGLRWPVGRQWSMGRINSGARLGNSAALLLSWHTQCRWPALWKRRGPGLGTHRALANGPAPPLEQAGLAGFQAKTPTINYFHKYTKLGRACICGTVDLQTQPHAAPAGAWPLGPGTEEDKPLGLLLALHPLPVGSPDLVSSLFLCSSQGVNHRARHPLSREDPIRGSPELAPSVPNENNEQVLPSPPRLTIHGFGGGACSTVDVSLGVDGLWVSDNHSCSLGLELGDNRTTKMCEVLFAKPCLTSDEMDRVMGTWTVYRDLSWSAHSLLNLGPVKAQALCKLQRARHHFPSPVGCMGIPHFREHLDKLSAKGIGMLDIALNEAFNILSDVSSPLISLSVPSRVDGIVLSCGPLSSLADCTHRHGRGGDPGPSSSLGNQNHPASKVRQTSVGDDCQLRYSSVGDVSNRGDADLFLEPHNLFNHTGQGSICSQAIMLITDGAVDTYDTIFAKYNWPDR